MTSVLLLNWHEIHVVQHTINRLADEPEVSQIIVVDNGSTDGSQDYLRYLGSRAKNATYTHVLLSRNTGPSVGRNVGLKLCTGEDIFLIDGDILYVPGTIKEYKRVMEYEGFDFSVGCVGYNDHFKVLQTGTNGAPNVDVADGVMPETYDVSKWFPMAWTQYGLFRGDLLREIGFVDRGVFGEAGHGYEDDWLYHDMLAHGYVSLAVNAPYYFHDAHYSLRVLQSLGLPSNTDRRGEMFREQWGDGSGWRESLAAIPDSMKQPLLTRYKGGANQPAFWIPGDY